MITHNWLIVLTAALVAALPATSPADDAPASWDGLMPVKAKRMDAVYLLPGADFRPYTKLMIDPTEVAFNKDWMKDINRTSPGTSRDVDQEQANKIAEAARSNFGDIFSEAFSKAGYQVVTTPGSDVLRLRPGVVNLYITAPDTMSAGRSRTYAMEAGEATLVLEVRDSTSNALLGRAVDRRATQSSGGMQRASRVSNLGDFRALFKRWAGICVKGMEELKAQSPVPADLTPKQKL